MCFTVDKNRKEKLYIYYMEAWQESLIWNNDVHIYAGYACGPKIDPRISLSNTLISLDLMTPVDSHLSLTPFLPFLVASWLLMPRHWLLPWRLPFIFLNQHHSLPSRTHSFARTKRAKEDNELLHRCNQPTVGWKKLPLRGWSWRIHAYTRVKRESVCVQKYTSLTIAHQGRNYRFYKTILLCLRDARVYQCIRKDPCATRERRVSSANSIVPYGTRSSFTRESRSGGLWWRYHRSRGVPRYVTSLHRRRMCAVDTGFNNLAVYSEINSRRYRREREYRFLSV